MDIDEGKDEDEDEDEGEGYTDVSDDYGMSDDDDDSEDSGRSETDGSLETLVDDEPLAAPVEGVGVGVAAGLKCFAAMDIDDEPPRGRSRTRISPTKATHSPLRRH